MVAPIAMPTKTIFPVTMPYRAFPHTNTYAFTVNAGEGQTEYFFDVFNDGSNQSQTGRMFFVAFYKATGLSGTVPSNVSMDGNGNISITKYGITVTVAPGECQTVTVNGGTNTVCYEHYIGYFEPSTGDKTYCELLDMIENNSSDLVYHAYGVPVDGLPLNFSQSGTVNSLPAGDYKVLMANSLLGYSFDLNKKYVDDVEVSHSTSTPMVSKIIDRTNQGETYVKTLDYQEYNIQQKVQFYDINETIDNSTSGPVCNYDGYGTLTRYTSNLYRPTPYEISYSKVEETVEDAQGNKLGSTVYEFYDQGFYTVNQVDPYPIAGVYVPKLGEPYIKTDPLNGQLKTVSHFNKAGDLVKKDSSDYEFEATYITSGTNFYGGTTYLDICTVALPGEDDPNLDRLVYLSTTDNASRVCSNTNNINATVVNGWDNMTAMSDNTIQFHAFKTRLVEQNSETVFYDDNGTPSTVLQKTEYAYGTNHNMPIQVTNTLSNGNTVTVNTEYPQDLSTVSAAEQKLIDQHRLSAPISVESQVEDSNNVVLATSSQYSKYHDWGNDLVSLKDIQTAKGTSTLEDRVSVIAYDIYGNPLEVRKTNGMHIIYVWGYSKELPIAKIENATYTGLASNIQTAIDEAKLASNLDVDATTENTLRDELEDLRALFPDAMVSTYTYDPRVGVTSMTDPRGYTMFYEYDHLSRLHQVRDASGFLLSQNSYVYGSSNYMDTTAFLVETTDGTTNALISGVNLTDIDKQVSRTYYDGLGRTIQTIGKQMGGEREDIITPMVYDEFARQVRDYLPYARSVSSLNLEPINTLIPAIESYYDLKYTDIDNADPNPFSEKRLEDSPLSRLLEQGAPGKDWAVDATADDDHTIKFEYYTNVASEVDHFNVTFLNQDPDEAPQLNHNGHYAANELYKTITKDENWDPTQTYLKNHTSEEFKNKQGQVVLKRTYADADVNGNGTVETNERQLAHDTYYVYDDYGNLTYVLSPKGSKDILGTGNSINTTVLDDLCYQYRYDYRNRLIEKKIPQKGWEYIVYDKLDRPVLTQDANLRADDDWLFTKYDQFGRVIYTGKHNFAPVGSNDNSGRTELQAAVDLQSDFSEDKRQTAITVNGTDIFYGNDIIPTNGIEIYTVNYYDDYNWNTQDNYEATYGFTLHPGLTLDDPDPNTVRKSSSSNSWNGGFVTTGTIEGDGYIQWTMKQTNKRVMIGLSDSNDPVDHNYTTIDYAINFMNNGTVGIYESGAIQTIPATTYAIDDVFRVERALDQITYYKNGVAFHASNSPSSGTLVGDSSFKDPNATIADVFIGYSSMGQPFTNVVKGLATGSMVRALTTNDWTTTTMYYDDKARSVYTISRNDYLETVDAMSSYMDFTGRVIKSHTTHDGVNLSAPAVTIDEFRYDQAGRLLRHEQQVNTNGKELISRNHYDDLGQLEQKQVGGILPSQSSLANPVNIAVNNNLITKSIGTNTGWGNSGASTANSISGDGYVSISPTKSGSIGAFACGLSYADPNQQWTTIEYAVYYQANGFISIREGGTNKGVKSHCVAGDVFAVERRGTTIYYLKNGEVFYVSDNPTTSAPMIGDLSLYHNKTEVRDFVLVDLENELQEVDYTYNVRGWLKGINDTNDLVVAGAPKDLFAFGINYNTNTLGGTALFNGNISETLWKTASEDPTTLETDKLRGYDYTYDAMNRILSADYHKSQGVNRDDYYNLSGIAYDRNGNILKLARSGVNNSGTFISNMDDLTYSYTGNQLTDVLEAGEHRLGFNDHGNIQSVDYAYDANGNMTADHNKDITIEYNHLNLPVKVTKGNGDIIRYTYDAVGIKLVKQVTENSNVTTTEYAGNYIYEDDVLQFFSHPEGYLEVDMDGNSIKGLEYVFQYKDHLGNIRLSYKDDNFDGVIATTEILEENNYYPFGLKHKGYNDNINGIDHPYGYNGIEETNELGLNILEMDMRQYDPAIARWTSIDPVTHHTMSTYNAFDNNPVFWADPSGANAVNRYGAITSDSGAIIWGGFGSEQFDNDEDDENDSSDDPKKDKKPKYAIYNVFPFSTMNINSLTDKKDKNYKYNFQTLTAYGMDPEGVHSSKLQIIYGTLSNLDEASQISILTSIGLSASKASKLVKNLGVLSLDPLAMNDGFLEALPFVGLLVTDFSQQKESDDRVIYNEIKWDNVMSGYNKMMEQVDMTNVILIFTDENLYKTKSINLKDSKMLDSKYPENEYKYVYYGTQTGQEITIFGRHNVKN